MDVTNADQARQWLNAWRGTPPKGVLAEAINGCTTALNIMNGARRRYSDQQVADQRAALAVLADARRELMRRNGML